MQSTYDFRLILKQTQAPDYVLTNWYLNIQVFIDAFLMESRNGFLKHN
jgi:hypothetical protein